MTKTATAFGNTRCPLSSPPPKMKKKALSSSVGQNQPAQRVLRSIGNSDNTAGSNTNRKTGGCIGGITKSPQRKGSNNNNSKPDNSTTENKPATKETNEQATTTCSKKDAKTVFFEQVCPSRKLTFASNWSPSDFRYVATLGKGGTATVYHAVEKESGYHVALKVQLMKAIDNDDKDNDNKLSNKSNSSSSSSGYGSSRGSSVDDNMFCEVDIHEQLRHRNIVRMIDHFVSNEPFGPPASMSGSTSSSSSCSSLDFSDSDDSDSSSGGKEKTNPTDKKQKPQQSKYKLFMILELCEGGNLFDVALRDTELGRLDEATSAWYFWDAVNAVEYLHKERNVIHCDIKSHNFIVCSETGALKLADFGMSVDDDARVVVGGSPVYMSPEHLMAWRDTMSDFDHRTDLYSLGVVLFEILVGYLPYEVVEDDEDAALFEKMGKLSLEDGNEEETDAFDPPILDLRKLNDHDSEEPFYFPPPIFPEYVSDEARDLVSRLMEPSPEKRISVGDAKSHPWFVKHGLF